MKIQLTQLIADPRNANVTPVEVMGKIKRNIERTGQCPALIVRPHPTQAGHYILIDGHHRLKILTELGWSEASCEVWEVDEAEAGLLLATLNRLRGMDDIHKRAELIEELTQQMDIPDLALLLPESEKEIDDLLALLRLDEEALEDACRAQIAKEEAELPVPLGFMVPKADLPIIEEALKRCGGEERGLALVALCKQYLEVAQSA